MTGRSLLFLDFDGVICDSALECFLSSREAYDRLNDAPAPLDSNENEKKRFDALRPYVRNSEDYLVIQEIIRRGIVVRDQIEFDAYIARSNPEKLTAYRRLFYEVRSASLARDPHSWLDSNPIFPHMKEPLHTYGPNRGLFILSTKRREYIEAILSHNGISMEKERIIASKVNERKLAYVAGLLNHGAGDNAVFVDDQVEHLKPNDDRRVTACVPTWGYIEKSRADYGAGIRVINENDMLELFATLGLRHES
jgi:phosphoglycolate phosphatase-like HAD superfamily hydrolase